MAQGPDWKAFLEAGTEFSELRRSDARRIARQLADRGQVARDQVGDFVEDLLDASRRRADALSRAVREEVQRQLEALGLAPKPAKKATAKKAPAKKTTAKKAPAKKTTAKKATAKKAAAKKTTAKKATAKKATAKKAPAAPASTASSA